MSLIELLCVIAIITLLAALLLPAVSQVKARARRLQCLNHLHEVGAAFVNFAGDHNGHFPMAVPGRDGGSLELAQSGYHIQGDFYFSFRHFQAASNQLVTPKLLVCAADTRLPATTFATLSNANLSYFIGVNAAFERPTSILAGDRNLTNDYATPATLIRLGHNYALRWTAEMHRFQGNLLFSDGHVEEKNTPALVPAASQAPAIAYLALPTIPGTGVAASSPGGGSSPSASGTPMAPGLLGGNSSRPASTTNALISAAFTPWPAVALAFGRPPTGPGGGAAEPPAPPPKAETPSTNALAAAGPAQPPAATASPSTFPASLAAFLEGVTRNGLWWLYALLLLIAVATLVLRKLARGRSKAATKSRVGFQ